MSKEEIIRQLERINQEHAKQPYRNLNEFLKQVEIKPCYEVSPCEDEKE